MYNAHLHVLHVVKEQSLLPSESNISGGEHTQNSIRHDPKDDVRKFVEKMFPFQTKVIQAVKYGQPYKEIVNYACSEDIDLIVIATHGRTGLSHMVMGSVAERVVRFSLVPVLTIKPPRISRDVASKSVFPREVSEEKLNEFSA